MLVPPNVCQTCCGDGVITLEKATWLEPADTDDCIDCGGSGISPDADYWIIVMNADTSAHASELARQQAKEMKQ